MPRTAARRAGRWPAMPRQPNCSRAVPSRRRIRCRACARNSISSGPRRRRPCASRWRAVHPRPAATRCPSPRSRVPGGSWRPAATRSTGRGSSGWWSCAPSTTGTCCTRSRTPSATRRMSSRSRSRRGATCSPSGSRAAASTSGSWRRGRSWRARKVTSAPSSRSRSIRRPPRSHPAARTTACDSGMRTTSTRCTCSRAMPWASPASRSRPTAGGWPAAEPTA